MLLTVNYLVTCKIMIFNGQWEFSEYTHKMLMRKPINSLTFIPYVAPHTLTNKMLPYIQMLSDYSTHWYVECNWYKKHLLHIAANFTPRAKKVFHRAEEDFTACFPAAFYCFCAHFVFKLWFMNAQVRHFVWKKNKHEKENSSLKGIHSLECTYILRTRYINMNYQGKDWYFVLLSL